MEHKRGNDNDDLRAVCLVRAMLDDWNTEEVRVMMKVKEVVLMTLMCNEETVLREECEAKSGWE